MADFFFYITLTLYIKKILLSWTFLINRPNLGMNHLSCEYFGHRILNKHKTYEFEYSLLLHIYSFPFSKLHWSSGSVRYQFLTQNRTKYGNKNNNIFTYFWFIHTYIKTFFFVFEILQYLFQTTVFKMVIKINYLYYHSKKKRIIYNPC